MPTRDPKTKASFIEYLSTHPDERFWQSIRNFWGAPFVFIADHQLDEPNATPTDTFYIEADKPEVKQKYKQPAVIFDIDGTLAERGDRGPFEWKRVGVDTPHEDILRLFEILKIGTEPADSRDQEWAFLIVTGRLEVCRKETEAWLEKYLTNYSLLKYDNLYMRRKDEEFEKDYTIKKRIYEQEIAPNYDVKYVFDDRDQTVKAWRELGLRCLQVAPGNF